MRGGATLDKSLLKRNTAQGIFIFIWKGQRKPEESPKGTEMANKAGQAKLQEETEKAAGAEQQQGGLERVEEDLLTWQSEETAQENSSKKWVDELNLFFIRSNSGQSHSTPSPQHLRLLWSSTSEDNTQPPLTYGERAAGPLCVYHPGFGVDDAVIYHLLRWRVTPGEY